MPFRAPIQPASEFEGRTSNTDTGEQDPNEDVEGSGGGETRVSLEGDSTVINMENEAGVKKTSGQLTQTPANSSAAAAAATAAGLFALVLLIMNF